MYERSLSLTTISTDTVYFLRSLSIKYFPECNNSLKHGMFTNKVYGIDNVRDYKLFSKVGNWTDCKKTQSLLQYAVA